MAGNVQAMHRVFLLRGRICGSPHGPQRRHPLAAVGGRIAGAPHRGTLATTGGQSANNSIIGDRTKQTSARAHTVVADRRITLGGLPVYPDGTDRLTVIPNLCFTCRQTSEDMAHTWFPELLATTLHHAIPSGVALQH